MDRFLCNGFNLCPLVPSDSNSINMNSDTQRKVIVKTNDLIVASVMKKKKRNH